jgi:tetratricopeptide (TPR) repeat protein
MAIIEASMAAGQGGASTLPTLLLLRSDLYLQLGQPDTAVADAERAVREVEESSPADTHTIGLGRAYLTLARALAAQGDPAGERAMLVTALAHFEDAAGADHPETLETRALLATAAP